jgi:hypothetical protein
MEGLVNKKERFSDTIIQVIRHADRIDIEKCRADYMSVSGSKKETMTFLREALKTCKLRKEKVMAIFSVGKYPMTERMWIDLRNQNSNQVYAEKVDEEEKIYLTQLFSAPENVNASLTDLFNMYRCSDRQRKVSYSSFRKARIANNKEKGLDTK